MECKCNKRTVVYPSFPHPIVKAIYSHVIRLHENCSLIKVVAMATKFYIPKETLTVKYTLFGYLCSI